MTPEQMEEFAKGKAIKNIWDGGDHLEVVFVDETVLNIHADCIPKLAEPPKRKHSHYFKDVAHLSEIDVYRVLDLFGVTDQAVGHAVKKLLCAGQRGAKDARRDIQEAVDTLARRIEMYEEDNANGR